MVSSSINLFWFSEIGFHIARAGLNSLYSWGWLWSSGLHFPNANITRRIPPHPVYTMLGIKPWALCVLDKHSPNRALSPLYLIISSWGSDSPFPSGIRGSLPYLPPTSCQNANSTYHSCVNKKPLLDPRCQPDWLCVLQLDSEGLPQSSLSSLPA